MVYYLKVNRICEYTFHNLQHWVDIIDCDDNFDLGYIVCDRDQLKNEILSRIDFHDRNIAFLHSTRKAEVIDIAKATCDKKWWAAACAHMTTFFHAKDKGYKEFWNIDADDTCICLQPARAYELLKAAEVRAKECGIGLFSLDMWRSYTKGFENTSIWSFGVTYTDNSVPWIEYMTDHKNDEAIQKVFRVHNLDIFFTYLSLLNAEKMRCFYCENMKFIHYSEDFISYPFSSGVSYWKKGEIIYPIILHVMGNSHAGKTKISEDVVELDISISDEETSSFFSDYAIQKLPMHD